MKNKAKKLQYLYRVKKIKYEKKREKKEFEDFLRYFWRDR